MERIDVTSLVAAGLLEEVSLDEGVGAFAMQLVQSRVCLGEHVLQLVGVLVDLCLDHAIGLHVVNLAVVLLVLFLVDGEGRFTDLRGLDIPEVRLFRNLRPLALVEVELPATVVHEDGRVAGVLRLSEGSPVAHELDEVGLEDIDMPLVLRPAIGVRYINEGLLRW